ncbi:MAG: cation:proton antiporter [Gammaproteobacteria bacterium]|nr:cation:proton antiporter [Gammaproteobacteria bacterium]
MDDLRLQEAVVFLAAAGLVIPLGKRFDLSPVLGFLIVGLAVGPHGLARWADALPWLQPVLVTDVAGVRALAELGVVFLLFMIGLELSLARLWSMRRLVFGFGGLQIVLCGAAIGGVAHAFANPPAAALVLGACLALSSTAVVMQLLTEQGRFGTVVGHGAFAVLLAQDLAVVPILFSVEAMGGDSADVARALGLALGEAILAVVAILGAGRLVLQPLFRFVSAARSPELFMAATLLIVIATAAATHAAGLSAALGAFLAGLLFAETEFRHEIEVDIEPFKGLLLGLFFMSIGMIIDLGAIAADPLWTGLSIVGLIGLKAGLIALLARLFAFTTPQAVELGLLLGQGGEFAFVVLALALNHALLPEPVAQFMLIVVAATMFLTPLVARVARALGRWLEARGAHPGTIELPGDLSEHVVLAGYGRTGALLAALLDRQRIAHVALDLDIKRIADARAAGSPVWHGDASKPAILERLRIDQASALVVTTDDAAAAERIVRAARQRSATLPIVARARDGAHARRLRELGASDVVPEVFEAGLEVGRMALEHAGLPPEAARELIDLARSEHGPGAA